MKDFKELKQKYRELTQKQQELGKEIERLEKVKDKKWKPEYLEEYFYYNILDTGIYAVENSNKLLDKLLLQNKNYYKTYEQCEADKQLHIGREKYYKLIEEINSEPDCPDNFPNWDDENTIKYCIEYVFGNDYIKKQHMYMIKTRNDNEYIYRELTDPEIKNLDKDIIYFLKNG